MEGEKKSDLPWAVGEYFFKLLLSYLQILMNKDLLLRKTITS